MSSTLSSAPVSDASVAHQPTASGHTPWAVFNVLALLLVLAPLYRSGKTPLAMLTLELLAIVGLGLLLWGRHGLHHLRRFEVVLLGGLVALPVIHLVPIPLALRNYLPGQAEYYNAQSLVGASGIASLSLDAQLTFKALLSVLVPVSVYWLTRALRAWQLRRLVLIFLAMALAQAAIGLMQYGMATTPDAFWHFGLGGGQQARGTWTSRNNFAGFLNGALMVALALFMATLGRHKAMVGQETLRERLVYFASWQGHQAFVYGFIALIVLLAVIFTRSRMGILCSMLGVAAVTVLFARRIGGDNVYGLSGTVVASVLGAAIAIGLGPVVSRFAVNDPLQDGRAVIFAGTLEGIGQFFPLGSGVGTYVKVFPRFQDLAHAFHTINRAHNSYLEWLFTGGFLAALLIAGCLFVYARQWLRLGHVWSEFRFLQMGAGLGCALTLIHDLADYNLSIPANLVYFAFLAGIFFHTHRDVPKVRKRRTKRTTLDEVRTKVLLPETPRGEYNPFYEPPKDGG